MTSIIDFVYINKKVSPDMHIKWADDNHNTTNNSKTILYTLSETLLMMMKFRIPVDQKVDESFKIYVCQALSYSRASEWSV